MLASELRVRIHLGGGKPIKGNYVLYILDASLPQALKHAKVYFTGCVRGLVIKLWSCTATNKFRLFQATFMCTSHVLSGHLG